MPEEGEEGKEEKTEVKEEKKEESTAKRQDEGEQVKAIEVISTPSKKRLTSKHALTGKRSLKMITESNLSVWETSSISLNMKRQSEFDRLTKAPKHQNTYRLDSKKPFQAGRVYKILEAIVLRQIMDYPNYDAAWCPRVAQSIAIEVRGSVKAMNYDRYKICVLIYIGEKRFQGFQAAFRALWDQERDSWTTYFYQTRTYFLSVTCYGIYHD